MSSYLDVHLYIYVAICQANKYYDKLHLCRHLATYIYLYLSIYLSTYLCIYMSTKLYIYMCMYVYIYIISESIPDKLVVNLTSLCTQDPDCRKLELKPKSQLACTAYFHERIMYFDHAQLACNPHIKPLTLNPKPKPYFPAP